MSLKAAAYKEYDSATRAVRKMFCIACTDRSKHMSARLKFNSLLMGMILLVICAGAAAQKSETYKVRLSTVPVDATMLSRVAGSGSLTAVLAGNKLTFNGSFQGLRSPATQHSRRPQRHSRTAHPRSHGFECRQRQRHRQCGA
jgi:hypothetical protein